MGKYSGKAAKITETLKKLQEDRSRGGGNRLQFMVELLERKASAPDLEETVVSWSESDDERADMSSLNITQQDVDETLELCSKKDKSISFAEPTAMELELLKLRTPSLRKRERRGLTSQSNSKNKASAPSVNFLDQYEQYELTKSRNIRWELKENPAKKKPIFCPPPVVVCLARTPRSVIRDLSGNNTRTKTTPPPLSPVFKKPNSKPTTPSRPATFTKSNWNPSTPPTSPESGRVSFSVKSGKKRSPPLPSPERVHNVKPGTKRSPPLPSPEFKRALTPPGFKKAKIHHCSMNNSQIVLKPVEYLEDTFDVMAFVQKPTTNPFPGIELSYAPIHCSVLDAVYPMPLYKKPRK